MRITDKQLDYELNMIEKMGFTDYFLIVADFVNYARGAGIPVGPGRGSAAGINGVVLPAASRTSTQCSTASISSAS